MSKLNFSEISRRRFLDLLKGCLSLTVLGKFAGMPKFAFASGQPPVWSNIPNQNWTVGVPVTLNLNNYVSDPENDPLVFSLSRSLPAGVTMTNGVISGTPSATFSSASFVATADDGEDPTTPNSPSNLRRLD